MRDKKINVAVLGTIGVGKSTLIRRFKEYLSEFDVEFVPEPSISLPYLSKVLDNFYKDTDRWAYTLQLGVSAAHEIHFEEMRKKDYDILLFDAPYSSFVYCNIHTKVGRMTEEDRQTIESVSKPFHFDYVVMVKEDKDVTIDRIIRRNREVNTGKGIPDLGISDFSYIEEHIKDYEEFEDAYIAKYFPNAKVIKLDGLPEDTSDAYTLILEYLKQRMEIKHENILS
jgi:deoxyadenosine/deoxycytidine kinase